MIGSAMALAAAATLQPTGKWVVDFADKACVLSRQYGTSEEGFVLHLKAPLIGKSFEIVIANPERKPSPSETGKGWIEKPDGRRVEPVYILAYSTEGKHRLSRVSVDPETYTVGEDGERLILHLDRRRTYDMALPDFAKAMGVLETCLKDLRQINGVDEQTMAQIATPAEAANINRLFSTDDYPSEAVRNGEQGIVGVLFWVETDGRVKDCKIIETSHRPSLDAQTCTIIIDRARFKPALSTRGQPIRSPNYQRVRWLMPE